jgi:hypothetical protein
MMYPSSIIYLDGTGTNFARMQVRYFVRGSSSGVNTTLTTRKEELEISGLSEKTEYGFQVKKKAQFRPSPF